MKKILFILFMLIIAFILAGAVAVYVYKDNIAKKEIAEELEELGVAVELGDVSVSILKTTILVTNLTVNNPKGFREKVLAEIPRLFIDFDIRDIWQEEMHFNEIDLDLANLYIEKTEDGKININEITASQNVPGKSKTNNGEAESHHKYRIDRLILNLGHVKAVDYSHGLMPNQLSLNMNIKNQVFKNVTDISEVAKIIKNKVASEHAFLGLGIVASEVAAVPITGLGLMGEGAAGIAETIIPFGHHHKEGTKKETSRIH